MIEDMEAELTGALKKTSNTDNLVVAEEANVDEAVTEEAKAVDDMDIDIKEERKTQAYQKTMNIYIENINTFEKRNKLYTTQWTKIYVAINHE